MHNSRICQKILFWDIENSGHGWFRNLEKVSDLIGYTIIRYQPIDLGLFSYLSETYFKVTYVNILKNEVKPDLLLLVHNNYSPISYLRSSVRRSEIAVINKLLCGVLKLEIETGRYKCIPRNERKCKLCNNTIETTTHFTCECPAFNIPRNLVFGKDSITVQSFCDKFTLNPFSIIRCVNDIWKLRQNML